MTSFNTQVQYGAELAYAHGAYLFTAYLTDVKNTVSSLIVIKGSGFTVIKGEQAQAQDSLEKTRRVALLTIATAAVVLTSLIAFTSAPCTFTAIWSLAFVGNLHVYFRGSEAASNFEAEFSRNHALKA